jgi:hypothetical protein
MAGSLHISAGHGYDFYENWLFVWVSLYDGDILPFSLSSVNILWLILAIEQHINRLSAVEQDRC